MYRSVKCTATTWKLRVWVCSPLISTRKIHRHFWKREKYLSLCFLAWKLTLNLSWWFSFTVKTTGKQSSIDRWWPWINTGTWTPRTTHSELCKNITDPTVLCLLKTRAFNQANRSNELALCVQSLDKATPKSQDMRNLFIVIATNQSSQITGITRSTVNTKTNLTNLFES